MGEKEVPSTVPANAHARSSDAANNKRRKCIILNITAFVISNILINTIMALTILKPRNPNFRVGEATLAAFNAANASLCATVNAQFSVKNTNFGRYSYRNTTVVFMHRGTPAGEVHVANSKVGWRSTNKFNVEVNLNLGINPLLRDDLNGGIIPITCEGKLRGRASIMFMMKKRRSADMKCAMEIVRETLQITNIMCK